MRTSIPKLMNDVNKTANIYQLCLECIALSCYIDNVNF